MNVLRQLSAGVVLSSLSMVVAAQPFWVPSGIPGTVLNLYGMASSSTCDTLLAGGSISYQGYWFENNPLMLYANGDWTVLPNVNGQILAMSVYHDTIIAAGNFHLLNDTIPANNMAYWTAEGWKTYGHFDGGLRKLKVIDDTLYAAGGFHSVDGVPMEGIVRRQGGHWEPVGQWNVNDLPVIIDFVKYNGSLVVIGILEYNNGRGISYLDNSDNTWKLLGPGFLGGSSSGHSLAVFQNELYVGGQIALATGNAGQDIMRWDGTAFHPVGNGVQRSYNDFNGFSDVRGLVVHNDLLYACGGFRFASGVPAGGVAIWDGVQWCAPGGDITQGNGYGEALAFVGDTLFVLCGQVADDTFVNHLARYSGTDLIHTCTPVGVEESTGLGATTGLQWMWMGAGKAEISGIPQGQASFAICDTQGRVVLQGLIQSDGANPVKLMLPTLATGVYIFNVGGHSVRFVIL